MQGEALGLGSSLPRVRTIRVVGDPVLRTACTPVTAFDAELQQLVSDMFDTMYAVSGVGLAANQIGVSRRIFVYDCPDDFDRWHKGYIVNPTAVSVTGALVETSEGCLSVPGLFFPRARASHVVLDGFDVHGETRRVAASNYVARCFLHELDHLDGELYIDRLAQKDRRAAMRALSAPDFGIASESSRPSRRVRDRNRARDL